jgi:hypothetical protein
MRRSKRLRKVPVYSVRRCWCGHTSRADVWVFVETGRVPGAFVLLLPTCAEHREVRSWPADLREYAAQAVVERGEVVALSELGQGREAGQLVVDLGPDADRDRVLN